MQESQVLSTTEEVKNYIDVNDKKVKELFHEGVIPSITTGSDKRQRHYTTTRLIDHTLEMIKRFTGENFEEKKDAFLSKELSNEIHKSSPAHTCEVITVTNLKGGVGKTSYSVNLAVILSKLGQRVLIVDMDSQSQSSRYFRKVSYKGRSLYRLFEKHKMEGEVTKEDVMNTIVRFDDFNDDGYWVDILPAEIKMAKMLELMRLSMRPEEILSKMLTTVRDEYDYIIIDTPPYSGLSLETSLFASDKVMLSTEAEEFSVEGMESTIDEINDLKRATGKDIVIDSIFVKSFTGYNHQLEALETIIEIAEDKLGLDSNESLFIVKNSPATISASQAAQLPIIEYAKKAKTALQVTDPIAKYAIKLIQSQKQ